MRIKIINGRLIDPAQNIDQLGALYIEKDKIVGLLNAPAGFVADKTIDAQGQIVCPGFIDLSARLREPGQSNKGTIESETKAAASAGFTSLCVPPDSNPVTDSVEVVELLKDKAEKYHYSQVYPVAALTKKLAGSELSSLYALKNAGCIAVSQAHHPIQDLLILRRAMEYAATHDLLLIFCPQEASLSNGGCAHEGGMASRYGLPSIPYAAETIALMQCIELIEVTGCRVHFSGISCARSVTLISKAKKMGLALTADVAMHQLHLTDDDMLPYDSAYHVIPPLRSEKDKQGLLAGVRKGIIDSICSDHQPHDKDAKLGAFPETEAGISSLETVLPLMMRLVEQGDLELMQAIAKLTIAPANILGLDTGSLAEGQTADVCVFDPQKKWQVNQQSWLSLGRNTPFWQEMMQAKVVHTIQAGKVIYTQSL